MVSFDELREAGGFYDTGLDEREADLVLRDFVAAVEYSEVDGVADAAANWTRLEVTVDRAVEHLWTRESGTRHGDVAVEHAFALDDDRRLVFGFFCACGGGCCFEYFARVEDAN